MEFRPPNPHRARNGIDNQPRNGMWATSAMGAEVLGRVIGGWSCRAVGPIASDPLPAITSVYPSARRALAPAGGPRSVEPPPGRFLDDDRLGPGAIREASARSLRESASNGNRPPAMGAIKRQRPAPGSPGVRAGGGATLTRRGRRPMTIGRQRTSQVSRLPPDIDAAGSGADRPPAWLPSFIPAAMARNLVGASRPSSAACGRCNPGLQAGRDRGRPPAWCRA